MKSRYEDKIKMALEMQCSGISASEALKQKIDQEIRMQGKIVPISLLGNPEMRTGGDPSVNLEDQTMKRSEQKHRHFTVKRFAIGVAAACLLLSGAAFAGKTAGYISGGRLGTYSYEEQDKAEKKLGFEVDLVKNFSNGYSFQDMEVFKTHAADENWKTLYTFPELDADYERNGVQDISLYVDQRPEDTKWSKVPDMTDQCGDIELRYDVVTYKFVPVGYELTEEDKANLERDDYEISEGADRVQMSQMTSVRWDKDGVHYCLLGSDTALSGEEMIEMAKEIIAGN